MRCMPGAVIHRRRGDELVGAIHEAALAELCRVGFANLTIEAVAERAGVGKASIYRRWPGKLDLLLDAMESVLVEVFQEPDTGSIRGDLISLLNQFLDLMNGPCGAVSRSALPGDEVLGAEIKQRLLLPRRTVITAVMRRAIDRGEIRSDADQPQIAEVGPMLLHAQMLHEGAIDPASVRPLVDDILLPMLRPLDTRPSDAKLPDAKLTHAKLPDAKVLDGRVLAG